MIVLTLKGTAFIYDQECFTPGAVFNMSDVFTPLQFFHQIYVEVLVAGRQSLFFLIGHYAGHMIVQSQAVGHGEVTQRSLVALGHVHGLAAELT